MNFYENLELVMSNFIKSGGFLSVKSGENTNTMTISWGFVGFMWKKPCFVVGVRPQRHTSKIIQNADNFTVSIPFGTMKEELAKCGSVSGANVDKSTIVNFQKSKAVESPIVAGCNAYYECLIKSHEDLSKTYVDSQIKQQIYPDSDFHTLYFGEIVECYFK